MTRFGRFWAVPENVHKPSGNGVKTGKYIKEKRTMIDVFTGATFDEYKKYEEKDM